MLKRGAEMKDTKKILQGIILVLAAIVVIETLYLIKIKQGYSINKSSKAKTSVQTLSDKNKEVEFLEPVQPVFPVDYYRFFADYDPFLELERMRRRIDKLFEDDFFTIRPYRFSGFRKKFAFQPLLNFKETDSQYVLTVDLPGMDKDSINVEVKGRFLNISGERKEEKSKEEEGFYHQELNYGSFFRSVLLPKDALVKNISSEYKNGVLTVIIPRDKSKKEEVQKIKVPVQ